VGSPAQLHRSALRQIVHLTAVGGRKTVFTWPNPETGPETGREKRVGNGSVPHIFTGFTDGKAVPSHPPGPLRGGIFVEAGQKIFPSSVRSGIVHAWRTL